ncbi:MAG TPA: hypothetical protein VMG32_02185 [Anaeromyxobacteraceae bacterium]|nr:hypothetical protein [Anaeromyxobacteraceae bacterium]
MHASLFCLLLALGGTPAEFTLAPARNAPPASSRSAAPAAPLSDAEVAARVHTYLAAIDTPIRPEQWQALGPRAVAPLEAVLSDQGALPSRRAKAVMALALLGGARARSLVLATARSDGVPLGVRASALEGAGHLLPPGELFLELRPVLEKAPAAPVRALAAGVLSRRAPGGACGAIRAQASREGPEERLAFGRALERCAAPPP